MLVLALSLVALAGDTADQPHVWARQAVAVAGWPSGLMSDTRVQYRTPLLRTPSIVFQDTFAGVGARVAVTPVFTEVGPRVTLAPIDVFDLELQASFLGYFGGGGQGLVGFDAAEHKLEQDRKARPEDSVRTTGVSLSAAPTFKLKLGPVVAMDGWTFTWTRLRRPEGVDAAFTYEPYRDLVVAWDDVVVEQQAALLLELLPGEDRPLLWIGGTVRDRLALRSKDRSTAVGGLVVVRPGTKPLVPKLVGQALVYVTDADRVGRPPNLAFMAVWEGTRGVSTRGR